MAKKKKAAKPAKVATKKAEAKIEKPIEPTPTPEPVPAPEPATKAPKSERWVVAKGHVISGRRGLLEAGDDVTPELVHPLEEQALKSFEMLKARGLIVPAS